MTRVILVDGSEALQLKITYKFIVKYFYYLFGSLTGRAVSRLTTLCSRFDSCDSVYFLDFQTNSDFKALHQLYKPEVLFVNIAHPSYSKNSHSGNNVLIAAW